MTQITVRNAVDRSRYEAELDGQPAGFAEYSLTPELVVFTHTEVDPDFEGQGVGGALAEFALRDVRDEGSRKVMPLCPFIKAWIERHPEFGSLVFNAAEPETTD